MARGKKTDSNEITLAKRRAKALELRLAGNSYRDIAKKTGVALSTSWEDINDGLLMLADQEQEKAKVLRQLELERLDALLLGHWSKAITGDYDASRVVLRIADRRAKLLGLDKPEQLDVTQNINVGPNWSLIQGVLMATLQAFPEARAAVAQALMQINPIEGELSESGSNAE
jgi:hypothetical protein